MSAGCWDVVGWLLRSLFCLFLRVHTIHRVYVEQKAPLASALWGIDYFML